MSLSDKCSMPVQSLTKTVSYADWLPQVDSVCRRPHAQSRRCHLLPSGNGTAPICTCLLEVLHQTRSCQVCRLSPTAELHHNISAVLWYGQSLQQVSSFVYLGATFQEDGIFPPEIRKRLAMGRSVMQSISKIWKSKQVTRSTKVRLIRALVWSVASCYIWKWGMDHSQGRRRTYWSFWDVVLPKSIESFMDRSQNKRMGTIKARSEEVTVSSHKKTEAELLWTYCCDLLSVPCPTCRCLILMCNVNNNVTAVKELYKIIIQKQKTAIYVQHCSQVSRIQHR